jgi:hypothetical protein
MIRRLAVLFPALLLFVIAAAAACRQASPPPPPASPSAFRPTATVKDIMDSMVDVSADVLWESVATIVNAKGVEDRQPRTDEEWAAVRRSAVTLVEATNLLLIDRPTAKPGEKAEDPGVELAPEQIDSLRKSDPTAWAMYAHGLYDAALPALQAIDKKDVQGLQDAGANIDNACEQCHLHYWYPNEKKKAS